MTTRAADGHVTLHAAHAAHNAPRRPSVYVYELWDHTSLILQYRGYAGYCVHRTFDEQNRTVFNDNYAYTIETALHEWLLRSPHRTVDGASADFFYVPSYLACTILPVYDWVGPGPFATGFPMRPVTAMRMALDALQQIRQRWPFFNASVASGRVDHLWLFPHDEGACWAPLELFEHSIVLTHWGRMDAKPTSSSRYVPDNWEAHWTLDQRAPAGQAWSFPPARQGGSRALIGTHPCYRPDRDLVIPVFAPVAKWQATPWLRTATEKPAEKPTEMPAAQQPAQHGAQQHRAVLGTAQSARPPPWDSQPRTTLAYFSGNLAQNEPLKYGRGIRQRLYKAFKGVPGWHLENKVGSRYSNDLSTSYFCIVPPGGDGWSSRVDDAVRHGCIPVIIMDNVHMPFETVLNYSAFAIRIAEKDVEQLDGLLRSVLPSTRRSMGEAMEQLWTRFVYAKSFLEADRFLPSHPTRTLPTDFLKDNPALVKLQAVVDGGAPDAFDTIMLTLATRGGAPARTGPSAP